MVGCRLFLAPSLGAGRLCRLCAGGVALGLCLRLELHNAVLGDTLQVSRTQKEVSVRVCERARVRVWVCVCGCACVLHCFKAKRQAAVKTT